MLVRSGQYQLGTKIQVDIRLSKGYHLLKNNKNKNEYVGNLLYDDISDIKNYLLYILYSIQNNICLSCIKCSLFYNVIIKRCKIVLHFVLLLLLFFFFSPSKGLAFP